MVDTIQLVTIVGLAVVAIVPLPLWAWKLWPKRLLGRKTEEVPAINLRDAVLFGFAMFAMFSCGMPAAILYLMGWDEFLRALLMFGGVGLFIGVGFGAALYVANNLQHRRAEKRKRRKLEANL
jgi:hypothetical protein